MMEYGSPIQSQFNSVKDIEEIVYGMGKWDPSITHPFLQKFLSHGLKRIASRSILIK